MHFPLESYIAPVTYGQLTGNVLRIDGNAGQIPPSFQFAVLQKTVTSENGIESADYALCYQDVSSMTPAQWAAWHDQEDAAYIPACVAANQGLQLL